MITSCMCIIIIIIISSSSSSIVSTLYVSGAEEFKHDSRASLEISCVRAEVKETRGSKGRLSVLAASEISAGKDFVPLHLRATRQQLAARAHSLGSTAQHTHIAALR